MVSVTHLVTPVGASACGLTYPIYATADPQRVTCPTCAATLVKRRATPDPRAGRVRSTNQHHLDLEREANADREAQIVKLTAEAGWTQKMLAERFRISPSRVGQILRRVRREAERS